MPNLDFDEPRFQHLLDKAQKLVIRQFSSLDDKKAYHYYPQKEIEGWFDEPLPHKGLSPEVVLDAVQAKVLDTATGNLGPHMYAYVMAGGTQMSIIAETLSSTINQNTGKWHLAPAINEIEKRVIKWGAEMIHLHNFNAGVLVSGGSAANLAGLTVARNLFFEKEIVRKRGMFGMQPCTVYASKEVHGCIDKSMETLGLGTNQLRKIGVNSNFEIDLEELEAQIVKDRDSGFKPFCIVGNAGTVNTGAIDDLSALSELSKKYGMWYHVDGAYGGLAASLDTLRKEYRGMEMADSIAIDFHKWLYQPFEAGCLIVKDWKTLKEAYYKKADYLDTSLEDHGRLDFNEHYFQLSRSNKALKIWMTYKTYGASLLKEMIQKDIDLAGHLADLVEESSDFELAARSQMAIACFRYKGDLTDSERITELNQQLIPLLEKDGRVFITGTRLNGSFVLRACLINHRKTKETTSFLLDVIREVGQGILESRFR